jgi:hypothetical protein
MAIMTAFQAVDVGSIPITRSKVSFSLYHKQGILHFLRELLYFLEIHDNV